jgi:hypothetical protein
MSFEKVPSKTPSKVNTFSENLKPNINFWKEIQENAE